MAVIAIEAGLGRAADRLAFIDQLKAIGVGSGDCRALEFVHDLGVAGKVLIGNQVFGRDAGHGLAYAIAVAVINDLHASGLYQAVFKVVDVRARAGVQQVAVTVIWIG